jgi:hydrogenase maturation factor
MKFLGSISDMGMIRKYWRFDHNIYLKKKKFKDFEDILIEHCLVMPCEVISVKKNEAVVKSPFLRNEVNLKTDFVDVKPRDKVTKHYDYICEKISEGMYQKMVESLKKL